MMRLQKKKARPAAEAAANDSEAGAKKATAAQLRLLKDVNDISLPSNCVMEFPDPDDLTKFNLKIKPTEGYYMDSNYVFNFTIGPSYPFEPPKVKCETVIYHPNIDLEGKVCLNILRQDWSPVLSLNSVVYGLIYLLNEPNSDDPLNKDAAEVLKSNPRAFQRNVILARNGGRLFSKS